MARHQVPVQRNTDRHKATQATQLGSASSISTRRVPCMKRNLVICVLAVTLLWSSTASADVWFELLYAGCFTGSDDDIAPENDNGVIGEVDGSFDCFNKDFNGDS